jgi:hypothetical protein
LSAIAGSAAGAGWTAEERKTLLAIAAALAERLGPIEVKPPDDPEAKLAAFTIPGAAKAIWAQIEGGLKAAGVTHMTAAYGDRFVEGQRCGWLPPCALPSRPSPSHRLSGQLARQPCTGRPPAGGHPSAPGWRPGP